MSSQNQPQSNFATIPTDILKRHSAFPVLAATHIVNASPYSKVVCDGDKIGDNQTDQDQGR